MAEINTEERNVAEVVIDGRIYELSGEKPEAYLHEVAGYLNMKLAAFKRDFKGYNKLEDGIKSLLLQINICDDLFLAREENKELQQEVERLAKDAYSAKHDLINTEMKMDNVLRQLEDTQRRLAEMEQQARATREDGQGGQGAESARLLSVSGGRKK